MTYTASNPLKHFINPSLMQIEQCNALRINKWIKEQMQLHRDAMKNKCILCIDIPNPQIIILD